MGIPGDSATPPIPSGHPTAPVGGGHLEGVAGGVVVTLGTAGTRGGRSLRASVSPKGGHRARPQSHATLRDCHRVPKRGWPLAVSLPDPDTASRPGLAPLPAWRGPGDTSCDTARVTPGTATSPPSPPLPRRVPPPGKIRGTPKRGETPHPRPRFPRSPGGSRCPCPQARPPPGHPGNSRGRGDCPGSPPLPTAAVSAGVGKAPSPGGGGGRASVSHGARGTSWVFFSWKNPFFQRRVGLEFLLQRPHTAGNPRDYKRAPQGRWDPPQNPPRRRRALGNGSSKGKSKQQ